MFVFLALPGAAFGKYSGGSGTAGDPYLIGTPEDLNSIGLDANDWDKHFKMIADINMAVYTGTEYNIIGNYDSPFTGIFDGNGHTILNFNYVAPYPSPIDIGLFGYVDGVNARIMDLQKS